MIGTIRAELTKIRSARLVYGLAGGSVALVLLQIWAISVALGRVAGEGRVRARFVGLTTGRFVELGANALLFALALGIITMAGEFRHRTADQTYLVTPSRAQVLLAKVVTVFGVSVAIAALTEAVLFALGLPVLAAKGVHLTFDARGWLNLAGALFFIGGCGVLGVAVGAIIRHQVGALIGALAWVIVAEQLVININRSIGKFLTVGLLNSLVSTPGFLARWEGALLLVGYLAVLGVTGAVVLDRADIT